MESGPYSLRRLHRRYTDPQQSWVNGGVAAAQRQQRSENANLMVPTYISCAGPQPGQENLVRLFHLCPRLWRRAVHPAFNYIHSFRHDAGTGGTHHGFGGWCISWVHQEAVSSR